TLSSRTPSKGKPERAIPYVGLLNPGETYYWRVRGRDADGVWGPWSQRWSFKCEAPGVPLDVEPSVDEAAGTISISWRPNPRGRTPVQYKVYGSNERGFTPSDDEYVVQMGKGFVKTMEEYTAKSDDGPDCGPVKTPANLVTATKETRLTVVAPALGLPNANKAYYRVVAVDEKGNESGPSDQVAVPRPFFYTEPSGQARAGQRYEYRPAAVYSIGHLTCREGYNAAFWERDELTYSLVEAPEWLKLDAQTGVVSGTPGADDVGRHQVVLRVENDRENAAEQRFRLTVAR
ncbi:MAG: putative Ig domain-containing protein, partial [Armatimonadota bacterium]